jgi:hypothetical protein
MKSNQLIFTKSTEQSSWKTNSKLSPASQEIPCILWNQKFYNRVHNLSLDPLLSQMNPMHKPKSDFPKIYA